MRDHTAGEARYKICGKEMGMVSFPDEDVFEWGCLSGCCDRCIVGENGMGVKQGPGLSIPADKLPRLAGQNLK